MVSYVTLVLVVCLLALVVSNNFQISNIMPTIKEIQAQVDRLQETLDAEQMQITAAIDKLNETIADLKQQLADGGTAEERQAVLDKLQSISDDLKNTIPDGTEG